MDIYMDNKYQGHEPGACHSTKLLVAETKSSAGILRTYHSISTSKMAYTSGLCINDI